MYKFIFNVLTDPLSLPIPAIYEYIILLCIGKIAFKFAWNASPGGIFGSEIHWFVRFISFFAIWAITYGVIIVCQWLLSNWILVLFVFGVFLLAISIVHIIKITKRKKISDMEDIRSERDEK